MKCRYGFERAAKCWLGYSPFADQRQKLERCDAHWHRPKRADWRAKAYERSALYACVRVPGMRLDGPLCLLSLAHSHEATCFTRRLGA